MAKLMTYAEYLEKNPTLWPTNPPTIDSPTDLDRALYESTQSLVYGQYQYMRVCDNNRFGVYFNDSLNRNYRRYNELMRVTPGIMQVDWMVEEFGERNLERTGENNTTGTDYATTTEKRAIGTTQSTTGLDTDKHTGTQGTEKTGSTTESGQTSGRKEYQGSHTWSEQGSGSDNLSYTGTKTTAENGSGTDDLTYSGTKTTSEMSSGSEKLEYNGQEKNDSIRTPNLSQSTTGNDTTTEEAGTKGIAKAMPMTSSYQGSTSGEIPALDWSNPSSQTQSKTNSTNNEQTTETVSNTGTEETQDTKSFTNRNDNKINSGNKETTEGFTGRSDNRSTSDSKTTTENYADRADNRTTSDSKTTQESFADRADVDSGTSSSTGSTTDNATTTYNETETHEKGTTVRTAPDEDKEDSTQLNRTTGQNGTTSGREHEISTGRHGYPSEILQKSQEFIRNSSAYAWFSAKLAENFMQILDIEDIWGEMYNA